MNQKEALQDKNDGWENRRLCSDGNCIGVIDQNGFCKECGRAYKGIDRLENTWAADDFHPDDAVGDYPGDTPAADDTGNTDSNDDWKNRRLCKDGNCIGVIGADGNCKECGKPYI